MKTTVTVTEQFDEDGKVISKTTTTITESEYCWPIPAAGPAIYPTYPVYRQPYWFDHTINNTATTAIDTGASK